MSAATIPEGSIELELGVDNGPHHGAGLLIRSLDVGDVFRHAGRRYQLTGKPRRARSSRTGRAYVARTVSVYARPLEEVAR